MHFCAIQANVWMKLSEKSVRSNALSKIKTEKHNMLRSTFREMVVRPKDYLQLH